ncbi:MAG: hypothetical protein LBV37_02905 [Mycoplasmataceae bacterium]|jgi:hypothetical protein|nr:hypothetical protein [Mycoplasmataceae bacterium]
MSTKKKTTKIAQMENNEFIKCQNGQEFKINFISQSRTKVVLEDIMATLEGVMNEMVKINERLANLESKVDGIDRRLTRVIQLNHLKE